MTCPMVAETKLIRPRLPAGLIDDPDRLALLDRSQDAPLTLVCAPAGFGKTTLVSQWLEQRQPTHAWLALEARDNEPALFWTGIREALARIDPHFDRRNQGLFQALAQGWEDDPVDSLVNALSDYARTWQAPQRLYLVLDDFHQIHNPLLLNQCQRLFDLAPALLRVVVVSRHEPPLRRARHLARAQALLVGCDQLRFSESQSRRFLHQRLASPVDEARARSLHRQTGGWPAALQLAGQVPAHREAPVNGQSDAPMLSDYLLEEVFGQLDDELQQFLLAMAPLPSFSEALANTVRQAGDSGELIGRMRQHRLLVWHLDGVADGPPWYRMHDLLRDWLLARPQAPEQGRRQRLAAARALADTGLVGDALELYLADQCYDDAERLLPMWLAADVQPVHGDLLQRFPAAFRRQSPALAVVTALFHFFEGQYDQVLASLDHADRLWSGSDQTPEPTLVHIGLMLRCPSVRLSGRHQDAATLVRQLEQGLDSGLAEDQSQLRRWALYTLGANAFMEAELGQAERYLRAALDDARHWRDERCLLRCLVVLVPALLHRGEVDRAATEYRTLAGWLRDAARDTEAQSLLAYLQGLLALEANDLVNARQQLERAWALGSERLTPLDQLYLLFALFRLALIDHRDAEALAQVARMTSLHRRLDNPWAYNVPAPEALRALVAWRQGDASALVRWSQQPAETEARPRFCVLHESLLRLAGSLLMGQPIDEPLALLQQAAAQGDNRLLLGRLQVLAAQHSWYREEAQGQAVALLAETLDEFVPMGAVRLFLDEGVLLEPILRACVARNQGRTSAQAVLRQGGDAAEAPAPELDSALLSDISSREREVLVLLGSGLTNKALSERLGISQATVKSHLSSIYGKLAVANRTGAVARARALGLVS